jgi:hypothetical protein
MSKSVSNDALWEKLSEIEEKINKSLMEQKALVSTQEQGDLTFEIKASKEEILNLIKQAVRELDANCNVRFKNIEDGIIYIGKDEGKILEALVCMWTEMKEAIKEQQNQEQKYTQSHFSFKFFKIRKTSVMIALLGLLVLILTLFSMKQQNDYSLLMGKYYRLGIEMREMRIEVDSLSAVNPTTEKK